ncbi:hypothetical protein SAMN05421541_103216 [Actinoplanes philippinensis]|uniref:PH domain-containing protein n=1 Tax=Actinoplanes philippinensis TaxID=35752 RepID=A0A1I2CUQ6_9ACTN|nr:hypothetical protein [Actinoplanes philippinensis]SFE72041.1 hypothetical protein SAMN05421541_103216 [Actinoplanes philippinensis]
MSGDGVHLRGSGHFDGGSWDAERLDPWAGDRPRVPRRAIPGLVLIGLFTPLFLVGAVLAAVRGEWTMVAGFAAWGGLFGHVAGVFVFLRWRPRRPGVLPATAVTPDGAPGLCFRYSGWAYFWLLGMLCWGALVPLAIAAVWFVTGGVAVIGAIALVGVALLVCGQIAATLSLAPGRLILTPDGLYHRGQLITQYSPWSGVTAVDAGRAGQVRIIRVWVAPSSGDRLRIRLRPWFLPAEERVALPGIVLRDPWLAVDPRTVHRALRHYLLNPSHRGELGGPAAVERIEQGRLFLY